jgi:hypothetical protein
MNRYLLAAIIGCVYAVGSAWLVRSEGEAYRRSLRSQRDLADGRGGASVGEDRPGRPAGEIPPPERDRLATDAVKPPVASLPATAAGGAEPPIAPAATTVQQQPTGPSADGPIGPSPFIARPAEPVLYDTRDLKPEEEQRLGLELHELILGHHGESDSGALRKRTSQAARSLLAGGSRGEIPYEYTILDSDEVFAFSHPGGYIYLSSGLFALLASEEELRFVIAHEEGYASEQEYEADAWALKRLLQLDQTRRECLAFLRKFQGYSEEHGFENGRKKPQSIIGAPVLDIENHFRAHPATWERLERLEGIFAKLGPRS